jgi:hypothetical protein
MFAWYVRECSQNCITSELFSRLPILSHPQRSAIKMLSASVTLALRKEVREDKAPRILSSLTSYSWNSKMLSLSPQSLCFALLRPFCLRGPTFPIAPPVSEPSASHGKSMLLLFDTACFLLCETLRNLYHIDVCLTVSLPTHNPSRNRCMA